MTPEAATELTFEEFERLPDQVGKLELLRGELIDMPPAKRRHSETAQAIFLRLLTLLTDAHPWLPGEVGVRHGKRWATEWATEAGCSRTSVLRMPTRNQATTSWVRPALAVEVISEGNTADAVDGKVSEYLTHGAMEVWVIYLKRGHLWIYMPNGAAEVHKAPFQSVLLGGAPIDVASFLV